MRCGLWQWEDNTNGSALRIIEKDGKRAKWRSQCSRKSWIWKAGVQRNGATDCGGVCSCPNEGPRNSMERSNGENQQCWLAGRFTSRCKSAKTGWGPSGLL